jgi:hypothetical protein
MRQEMLPEIDRLIKELTQLRSDFENGIDTGRSYIEVKNIYLQMQELLSVLKQLQASGNGQEASAN